MKAKLSGDISEAAQEDELGEESAKEIEAVSSLVSLLEDIYGEDDDDQDDENGDETAAQEDLQDFKEVNQVIGEVFSGFTHAMEHTSDGRNVDVLNVAPDDQIRELTWAICPNEKSKDEIGTLVINYK